MQHLKDDRALFDRRGRFVAIALGVAAIVFSSVGFGLTLWRHYHHH